MRFSLKYTRGFHTMCNTCFNSCRSCQSCNFCNYCRPCNTCNACGGLFGVLFDASCGHRCGCDNRCGYCEQARKAAITARMAAVNACRCAAVAARAAARAERVAHACDSGCGTNTCGFCGTNPNGFDAYYVRQYHLYPEGKEDCCNCWQGD